MKFDVFANFINSDEFDVSELADDPNQSDVNEVQHIAETQLKSFMSGGYPMYPADAVGTHRTLYKGIEAALKDYRGELPYEVEGMLWGIVLYTFVQDFYTFIDDDDEGGIPVDFPDEL